MDKLRLAMKVVERSALDELEKGTPVLVARETTASSAPSSTSCGPKNTSPECQKPTDTPVVPILAGILVPAVIALVLFLFLHRRHKQRLRAEDANDRTKSLDFGMQFPGSKLESGPNEKLQRRQRGMSLDVDGAYMLPPGLHQQRDSIHSMSRSVIGQDDKYSPATNFLPDSRNNSLTGSMNFPTQGRHGTTGREDSSIRTGSSRGMHGFDSPHKELLKDHSGIHTSRPSSRNGSKLGHYKEMPEIRLPPAAARSGSRSSWNRGGEDGLSAPKQDGRDSYIDNNTHDLRRSHDYLAGFLKARNSNMPMLSAKPPASRTSEAIGESIYENYSRGASPKPEPKGQEPPKVELPKLDVPQLKEVDETDIYESYQMQSLPKEHSPKPVETSPTKKFLDFKFETNSRPLSPPATAHQSSEDDLLDSYSYRESRLEPVAAEHNDSAPQSRNQSRHPSIAQSGSYSRHQSVAQRSDTLPPSTESSVGTTHHSVVSDFDFDRNEHDPYPPTPPSVISLGEVHKPLPSIAIAADAPSKAVADHYAEQQYQEHDDSSAVRPLPSLQPGENKEQRRERIRSFYKDYFEEQAAAPAQEQQQRAMRHMSYYEEPQAPAPEPKHVDAPLPPAPSAHSQQHQSQQPHPQQHEHAPATNQYQDEYYDEYDDGGGQWNQGQHPQQYDNQYYDDQYYDDHAQDYGHQGYDDSGFIYDYETGEYYPAEPQAPFMEAPPRRAFTPPPRAPPRFHGHGRGGHSSRGSFASQGSRGPRAYSSASGRFVPPRRTKPRPPPQPLLNLPTPHKLATDAQIMQMIDFAPPTTYRDRAAGVSDTASLRGGARPYSPSVRAFTPLASSHDELAAVPSPHMLRKSGTFTALDFAPVPRLFKNDGSGSDSGSIRSYRSNRSGISQVHSHNIRTGAYRVSRLPQDMVFDKNDIAATLKPTWGLRPHDT